ncbi:MAG: hypothetical protein HY054_02180 [Proteobacteria bacterium]|nr:hypothetical protein [Pseudomonadota bacterium]
MDAEVQILRGPSLTVTDRRIVVPNEEIQISSAALPEIEHTTVVTSATPVVATIGLIVFALGLMAGGPLVWGLGFAIAAFSVVAKTRRQGFSVTIARDGRRQSIYTTHNEADAKLALAALLEARRRCAS